MVRNGRKLTNAEITTYFIQLADKLEREVSPSSVAKMKKEIVQMEAKLHGIPQPPKEPIDYMKYEKEAHKKIWDLKVQIINDLLNKCTKDQQDFFSRLRPCGVTPQNFDACLDLLSRTVVKNEMGREHILGSRSDEPDWNNK